MRLSVPIHLLLLCAATAFLAGVPTDAQSERILDFHSDITLTDDSSLQVRETITVFCAGGRIRHGIYRDFPTRYTDPYNTR